MIVPFNQTLGTSISLFMIFKTQNCKNLSSFYPENNFPQSYGSFNLLEREGLLYEMQVPRVSEHHFNGAITSGYYEALLPGH